MSFAEKAQQIVGITPSHTNVEREAIRAEAKKNATTTWFNQILEHHMIIEQTFDAVKDAKSLAARTEAQKKLMILLTGHSIAEEAIVYPFMKLDTSSKDAIHAYAEQSLAKIELVGLDEISDKMSKAYDDKLEEIRLAVVHHMIEEERDFFPELQEKADNAENTKISKHYNMEFERYVPSVQ